MCDWIIPELYDRKLLKTRRPHRCIESGELAPSGAKMFRVKSLIEGYFSRHYTCLDCEAIRHYILKTDPCADLCHGELNEWLLYDCFYDTLDLWYLAQEEQFPSLGSSPWNSFIKASYCSLLPKVSWLSIRIGGKFKLADEIRDTILAEITNTSVELVFQK